MSDSKLHLMSFAPVPDTKTTVHVVGLPERNTFLPSLSANSASACSGVRRSPSAISISRHPFDQ